MDWIKRMKEREESKTTSRFRACDVKWLVHGDFLFGLLLSSECTNGIFLHQAIVAPNVQTYH